MRLIALFLIRLHGSVPKEVLMVKLRSWDPPGTGCAVMNRVRMPTFCRGEVFSGEIRADEEAQMARCKGYGALLCLD